MYFRFIFLSIGFLSCNLAADVPAGALAKTAPEIKEPPVSAAKGTSDVQGASRLRVEGAEFKTFNLFFPPAQLSLFSNNLERKYSEDIRQIIERDLAITGGFKIITGSGVAQKIDNEALLKQKGAEGVTYLSLSFNGSVIRAVIEHKNFITPQGAKYTFEGTTAQLRRLAHQLARSIYENYIGPEDLFLRQIAAVKKAKNSSQVVLLDFDGQGEIVISSGISYKSTPYFSPDGKTILYTIISDEGQRIVEQEIGSKNIQTRTHHAGNNMEVRVLPDNSGLLATLSLGKIEQIYKLTRSGEIISKITDGWGPNLSPSISADGKKMAFVSNRSGTSQIYEQILDSKSPPERLSPQGRYNQTPHYSPDAKLIAFTGRDEQKVLDVFLLERSSKRVSRITQNQGRNQEPYFVPSGNFVVLSSERAGHAQSPELYLASLNGNHQYRLTTTGGYVTPVVRPGIVR